MKTYKEFITEVLKPDEKTKKMLKLKFGKQSSNSDFADNDNALTQHEKR